MLAGLSLKGVRMGLGSSKPLPALVVVVALLAVMAAGLRPSVGSAGHAPGGFGDVALYRSVIDDVRHGVPYYQAAAQEHRRHGYPLRPFVVVRPPMLAVAMAALPNELVRRLAVAALALGVLAAWGWRLAGVGVKERALVLAVGLLGAGLVEAFSSFAYPFHEVWAGLLIALSLALRRPDRWGWSLALGLLAALTRELAGAYLLAMAAMALRDGCRKEALAWTAALAAFAGALFAHGALVDAQVLPTDLTSQGWLKLGGWSFVLSTMRWNALLVSAPQWVLALVAPLAFLGLALWRDPLGERLALTVFGYAAAFLVIGRPENDYWGLLIAPLWPLGLLLAPGALAMLSHNALSRGAGRKAKAPYVVSG